MPALYLPILLMLLALILRGVAFEFRHHGRRRGKAFWTAAFAGGSLAATLAQGLVLGGFIQGVTLDGRAFAGGPFDWLTPYTLLVAVGLVAGYALLGATWLVWRPRTSCTAAPAAGRWIAAGAVGRPAGGGQPRHPVRPPADRRALGLRGRARFDLGRLLPLLADPAAGPRWAWPIVAWGLRQARARLAASSGAFLVFLSGYLGLAVGFFPNIVPYDMTFRQAATADNALALMLVRRGDPAAGDPRLHGLGLLAVPRQGRRRCGLSLSRRPRPGDAAAAALEAAGLVRAAWRSPAPLATAAVAYALEGAAALRRRR